MRTLMIIMLLAAACGPSAPPAESARMGVRVAGAPKRGCERYCECIDDLHCIAACEAEPRLVAMARACEHVPCESLVPCMAQHGRRMDGEPYNDKYFR